MIDLSKIALLVAERLRELATRQGIIPFWRGDLRKSIYAKLIGPGTAAVGSNLPYARAVHDGRPAVTIRPKRKKALFWRGAAHPVKKVVQPPRKGKPFFRWAMADMQRGGFDFLLPHVEKQIDQRLKDVLPMKIEIKII
jgi:hypothetical protein